MTIEEFFEQYPTTEERSAFITGFISNEMLEASFVHADDHPFYSRDEDHPQNVSFAGRDLTSGVRMNPEERNLVFFFHITQRQYDDDWDEMQDDDENPLYVEIKMTSDLDIERLLKIVRCLRERGLLYCD